MLNQTGFTTVSGTTRKIILVDEKNSTAISCKVANTGVSADSAGKKIVKAGTPLNGDFTARNTAFTVAVQTAAAGDNPASNNANCILLHDVDVTDGTKNAQAVIFGTIDLNKLDSSVQSMITAEAKAGMKMIQFIK